MDSAIVVALIGAGVTVFNVIFTAVSAHRTDKKRQADLRVRGFAFPKRK